MGAEVEDFDQTSKKPVKEKKKRSTDNESAEMPSRSRKKGQKKEERENREQMYAESQRLLRESKVAFQAPEPVVKPVSIVLQKIRQRRLQLGCSPAEANTFQEVESKSTFVIASKELNNALHGQASSHVDLTNDEDTEVEFQLLDAQAVCFVKEEDMGHGCPVTNLREVQPPMDPESVPALAPQEIADNAPAGDDEFPGTPEIRTELTQPDVVSRSTSSVDAERVLCAPVVGSQELLCTSQLSPEIVESPEAATPDQDNDHLPGSCTHRQLALHTQPQDEYSPRWPDEDSNKENRVPSSRTPAVQSQVYTMATHVRAFIDDEAEDEDEDLLAENAEEEEAEGDGEDLRDMFASTQEENVGYGGRRASFHRKWLEQQDTAQTDDILERLRTGRSSKWKGRDRVVSCLDDEEELDDDNSDAFSRGDTNEISDEETDPQKEPVGLSYISLPERGRKRERETKSISELYPGTEEMDIEGAEFDTDLEEDKAEQAIFRQRLLEETEEHAFLSPAEDESSREVFGLINKVNVASAKAKPTLGNNDGRGSGSGNIPSLPSKPSFVGRASLLSIQPTLQRQSGSGSSRSFVFSRNDSNSSHGFPPEDAQEDKMGKTGISPAPIAPKKRASPAEDKRTQGRTKRNTDTDRGSSDSGPSLFEMLRRQAAELNKTLQKKTSSSITEGTKLAGDLSVFAAMKSFRPTRGSRGL